MSSNWQHGVGTQKTILYKIFCIFHHKIVFHLSQLHYQGGQLFKQFSDVSLYTDEKTCSAKCFTVWVICLSTTGAQWGRATGHCICLPWPVLSQCKHSCQRDMDTGAHLGGLLSPAEPLWFIVVTSVLPSLLLFVVLLHCLLVCKLNIKAPRIQYFCRIYLFFRSYMA